MFYRYERLSLHIYLYQICVYAFYVFEICGLQAFQFKIYRSFNLEPHRVFAYINGCLKPWWQYAETWLFLMLLSN